MNLIVVKYGGNAMLNPQLQRDVVNAIITLKAAGFKIVVVHGGGPFIARQLEQAGIVSEFVDGHRITTPEAMIHVEMALKGLVNGKLVSLFNEGRSKAIGLSGKDAQMVIVEKREHKQMANGTSIDHLDLGRVGDVVHVDTNFIHSLLQSDITPVIACMGIDENGFDYNVNGDMMAGHIAGALQASSYIVLTDIDGLRHNVDDPSTHIANLTISQARSLFNSSIKGGMIPKIESCILALEMGAGNAMILNGTKPESLINTFINNSNAGTTLTREH